MKVLDFESGPGFEISFIEFRDCFVVQHVVGLHEEKRRFGLTSFSEAKKFFDIKRNQLKG